MVREYRFWQLRKDSGQRREHVGAALRVRRDRPSLLRREPRVVVDDVEERFVDLADVVEEGDPSDAATHASGESCGVGEDERVLGDAADMVAQIDNIMRMLLTDKDLVQIIPFAAGAYAAADGYFVLLEFEEESNLFPMVFIEGLTDNRYLQRADEIARYRETIEYLRGRALNVSDSIALMNEMRQNYASR